MIYPPPLPDPLKEYYKRNDKLFGEDFHAKLNNIYHKNHTGKKEVVISSEERYFSENSLESCYKIHNSPAVLEHKKIVESDFPQSFLLHLVPNFIESLLYKGNSSGFIVFNQVRYSDDIKKEKYIINNKEPIIFMHKNGLCYGLAFAWLVRQGNDSSNDFFEYIKTESGYDEICYVHKIQKSKNDIKKREEKIKKREEGIKECEEKIKEFEEEIKKEPKSTIYQFFIDVKKDIINSRENTIKINKDMINANEFIINIRINNFGYYDIDNGDKKIYVYTINDYVNDMTGKKHRCRELAINIFPTNDGRYHIRYNNNHTIALFIDNKTNKFKLFDANYGEYSFFTLTDMKNHFNQFYRAKGEITNIFAYQVIPEPDLTAATATA
ncbi:YopT-type cysteine protease domain-containing protein [Candidatus Regiella endosymbiont of Tuberolachnus salignus]|uniref:YopT-type cysteine protease domain-containing protein n=1 Tax=Candidatus Regiella endosymbiont of Tuberolachnus salignus TaxID=3077956 RepID=UPI0030CF19B8